MHTAVFTVQWSKMNRTFNVPTWDTSADITCTFYCTNDLIHPPAEAPRQMQYVYTSWHCIRGWCILHSTCNSQVLQLNETPLFLQKYINVQVQIEKETFCGSACPSCFVLLAFTCFLMDGALRELQQWEVTLWRVDGQKEVSGSQTVQTRSAWAAFGS